MKAKRAVSALIFLAMLLSLLAVPAHAVSSFTDVAPAAYYANSVAWAVEKGITNGTTDTTFSPETICTRAQIVTFLYRYLGNHPVSTGGNTPQGNAGTSQSTQQTWSTNHETPEEIQRAIEESGKIARGESQLLVDENGQYYYEY